MNIQQKYYVEKFLNLDHYLLQIFYFLGEAEKINFSQSSRPIGKSTVAKIREASLTALCLLSSGSIF